MKQRYNRTDTLIALNSDGTWSGEIAFPSAPSARDPYLAALSGGRMLVGGTTDASHLTFGTKAYPDLGGNGIFVGEVNASATDYTWISSTTTTDTGYLTGMSVSSGGTITVSGIRSLLTSGGNSNPGLGDDWTERLTSSGQWW